MKDYYQILGVSKNATQGEIKKAFHKMAHKYHPDKQGGDEQKFKEINEAYQILSNAKKRQQYDDFGNPFNGSQFNNANNQSGFDFDFDFMSNKRTGQGGFSNFSDFSNLDDILRNIFGQAFYHGKDIVIDIEITFKASIQGTSRDINLPQGKLNIVIPAGIHSGEEIRIPGQGERGAKNYPSGDLYVRVYVKKDRRFDREEDNIVYKQSVSFTQAALGDKIKVPTLDGDVEIKVPAGIQSGERIRLRNKGVAGKGDELIEVIVKTPTRLSREQKRLLEQLNL